jgi:hypothetical protein
VDLIRLATHTMLSAFCCLLRRRSRSHSPAEKLSEVVNDIAMATTHNMPLRSAGSSSGCDGPVLAEAPKVKRVVLSASCKDGDVLVGLMLLSLLATSSRSSSGRKWRKHVIAARHSAPIEGCPKAGLQAWTSIGMF